MCGKISHCSLGGFSKLQRVRQDTMITGSGMMMVHRRDSIRLEKRGSIDKKMFVLTTRARAL
jgi:hypothetical protein